MARRDHHKVPAIAAASQNLWCFTCRADTTVSCLIKFKIPTLGIQPHMLQRIKKRWSFLTYLRGEVSCSRLSFFSWVRQRERICNILESLSIILESSYFKKTLAIFYCIHITFLYLRKRVTYTVIPRDNKKKYLRMLATWKQFKWLAESAICNNNINHRLLSPSLFVRLMALDGILCDFLRLTNIISVALKMVLKGTQKCYCGHDWVFEGNCPILARFRKINSFKRIFIISVQQIFKRA